MKAFANYHPLVLMIYFFSVILIAMFSANPILQLLSITGGSLFCVMLQSRKAIADDIGFYLPLFVLIAITNPLFSHNGATPLFFMNGNPVTLEAVIYGVAIAVMIIAVMMWFKAYSAIISSDKFIYLFGKAVPKLSLILSMALRFIPMFKRQLKKVNRVQKAMGYYSSDSIADRIKNALKTFGAMAAWSIENAMETSVSMKARGYGLEGRTNFSIYRFYANDRIILSDCMFLLGIVLFGLGSGEIAFTYYPTISTINLNPVSIAIYTGYGVLALTPFIIEVKEAIVWRYYISKI